MTLGNTIATCGRPTIGLAKMLLEGVSADRFARLATGASGPVQSNHPAFVYGHLALYPHRICQILDDADAAAATVPPGGWAELFGAGASCQDDPDGSIYPPMDETTAAFFSGYQTAITVVANATDAQLAAQNPNEAMRERLGLTTVGMGVAFALTSHPMMHLGQVSAWRRMEGLGTVM